MESCSAARGANINGESSGISSLSANGEARPVRKFRLTGPLELRARPEEADGARERLPLAAFRVLAGEVPGDLGGVGGGGRGSSRWFSAGGGGGHRVRSRSFEMKNLRGSAMMSR